jgi:hypothetical protein
VPLTLDDRTATLTGFVTVDDAETFVAWLRRTTEPAVDLHDCVRIHTAVFQAILAFRPIIAVGPEDTFLAGRIVPMLSSVYAGARNDEEVGNDDSDVSR